MRVRPPPSRLRRLVAFAVQGSLLASAASAVEPTLQDGIDRNLQERRTRGFELRMDLDPGPAPAPAPETELRRSVVVPRADPGILDRLPRIPPQGSPSTVEPPRERATDLTIDSQRRRQQALQAQTRTVPAPERRRMLDAQQLQFERELRSERLRSEMMRESGRAMPR